MGVVTALLVSILPVTAQAASQAEAVINADGGGSGQPGLRIHYANGELQVVRNGSGQLFHPAFTPTSPPSSMNNAIALYVDGAQYLPGVYTDSTQAGGSLSGSGTITGTIETGDIDVAVTITYTYPNEYFNITLVVVRGGTTDPLKLYHFVDSFLDGGDQGPGFFSTSPATVGVVKPGTVEAFRYVGGPSWTGYFSGFFAIPWSQVGVGADFDNVIDADPNTDNGYGIMWNLGTAAGIHLVSYDMIFAPGLPPVPDAMAAPVAVAGDTNARVSLTAPADNGSAIIGYTVTAAPGGASCTVATATSCVVPGLANGTAYTFTATATNGNGTSSPSAASNSVTPTAPDPAETSTTNPFDVGGPGFIDVPAGEMAVAASWLAVEGITFGCEGGASPRYCPKNLATRAEIATLLTRALDLPATEVDAFRDDDDHLLEDSLNRAAAAGIFLGCSDDGDVCPDDAITRGELAAVLVRALDLVSIKPAAFSDVDGHWAESFVGTIGGLGITNGCIAEGNAFCPDTFGTRGETALLLYRALTLD
jgi:hypothetical protein